MYDTEYSNNSKGLGRKRGSLKGEQVGKGRTQSEKRKDVILDVQSSTVPILVYGDKDVDFGSGVDYGDGYKELRQANQLIREKNDQILYNLKRISKEIDLKNRMKHQELRSAYSNLASNTRNLLHGVRDKNYFNTIQTPYEQQYGYKFSNNQKSRPISHYSTFIKADTPNNKYSEEGKNEFRTILIGFDSTPTGNELADLKHSNISFSDQKYKRLETTDALDEIISGFEQNNFSFTQKEL